MIYKEIIENMNPIFLFINIWIYLILIYYTNDVIITILACIMNITAYYIFLFAKIHKNFLV